MDVSECLQNLRSDGSELCSQFGRYMSPAYHHDKCERCVHMRLYSMHKAEITFVYAIFAVLSLLAVIIGLSGPPIEYTHVYDVIESGVTVLSTNATSSTHELIKDGGPFVYITPALTRYNKQFWLFIVLHTENSDDEIYSENMLTTVSCAGISITKKTANSVETTTNNEVAKPQFFIYENEQRKNRTRYIWCKKRTCEPLRIAHLSFIKFTRYRFQIQFQNFESFHRKYNVRHVTFLLKSYSSDFTQMEMSFRIIYVVTTVFATLWFCNSLRKYVISDWSYEQKWSVILLILLLFYNGPAYSLTTIVNHWLIGFIDGVSQVTFLAALALFNLCIYHALRQNERRFLSFYLEKVIIVFILWSLSTIVVYYHRVQEYEDFSFSFELDSRVYERIVRWWLVFAVIYVALLLLSMLKAYTDLRTMPFFDKRLKFATTNVIVIMAIIWVTYNFNYGITGIIEDTYVANGTSQIHSTSTIFMVVYAFLNFYTYLIVYVYSPAQKSIYENVVMKDNPAFSMIHDSEDEDATTLPVTSVYTKSRTSKAVTNNTSLLYSSEEEENHRNIPCHFNGRTDDSD